MVYDLVNIAVALSASILYIYTARKYSYRIRDEFCDVYRYAEDLLLKVEENRDRNQLQYNSTQQCKITYMFILNYHIITYCTCIRL